MTSYFSGRGVKVEKAYLSQVEWKTNPHTGKTVMKEVPGSETELDIELVLIAAGFVHADGGELLKSLNPELDARGNIKIDSSYSTSVPGVFAAGDAASGASLVVRALNAGMEAADSMNDYLN